MQMLAFFYKKDRSIYEETVRRYTFLFANYSQFIEDIKNMNITIKISKDNLQIYEETND